MASLSAMDAERGSGGRYLERFDLATLILYLPLVAENLPLLTGAIVISTTTVSNNPTLPISSHGEVFLHGV